MSCFYKNCLGRRVRIWVQIFILLWLSVACGSGQQELELVLLHTNDSHGSVMALDSVGGMAERATFVRWMKTQNRHVLLVDAGDFNIGQPVSNIADAQPDILAYNKMGYDAITVGNHEFDKSFAVLSQQMGWANFPFLTTNVEKDGKVVGDAYLIKEYDGIKVGLFGITTRATTNLSLTEEGFMFRDECVTARKMVKLLRDKGVDLVIALTHLGFIEMSSDFVTSIKLAQEVNGIDIIVDGHSHSYIQEPLRVGNTRILTAGDGGRYVGMGKLMFRNGILEDLVWKPVLIKGFQADTAVVRMLQPFLEQGWLDSQIEIGTAVRDYPLMEGAVNKARCGEHPLGNLVADALCWKVREGLRMDADFSILNAGTIRMGLSKGKITKGNVLTMLPFRNTLGVVEMTGVQVKQLFADLATISLGEGGFPQVSAEVHVEFDVKSKRLLALRIGGRAIDDRAIYRVVVSDYLMQGKDGYALLREVAPKEYLSYFFTDIVMDYICFKQTIAPELEGRIVVVNEK